MPGACCSKRKHTPITTEAQRGFFGATLRRRRQGSKWGGMKGITTAELRSHLHEAKGKKLPKRKRKTVLGKR